jgi:hypothetical protein
LKIEKLCWSTYDITLRPKNIQSAIGPLVFQRHVDPEKVSTTMNETKVAALRTAPTQSIRANLLPIAVVGCGLYRGKSQM